MPGEMSTQHSALSTQHSALGTQHLRARRGFTMIELMIVVGIIAILGSLILPTASRLIENSKISNTKRTMEIVQNAINKYKERNPLGNSTLWKNALKNYFGTLPPDFFQWDPDTTKYEYFLPTSDDNGNGIWDLREVYNNEQLPPGYEGNPTLPLPGGRYNPVILCGDFSKSVAMTNGVIRRTSNGWEVATKATPGPDYSAIDYRSIEALYLYITELCPEGKDILKKVPLGNKDTCSGAACPDAVIFGLKDPNVMPTEALPMNDARARVVDLNEVLDAWGRPLRYQVRPYRSMVEGEDDSGPVTSAVPNAWQWELRSAGADEQFSPMFSDEPQSDDVVLRGQ